MIGLNVCLVVLVYISIPYALFESEVVVAVVAVIAVVAVVAVAVAAVAVVSVAVAAAVLLAASYFHNAVSTAINSRYQHTERVAFR